MIRPKKIESPVFKTGVETTWMKSKAEEALSPSLIPTIERDPLLELNDCVGKK